MACEDCPEKIREQMTMEKLRPSCLDCARKHIAQAIILLKESMLGHPAHFWLAIGHLAEAEAETIKSYPELASKVRKERKGLKELIDNTNKESNLLLLIKEATKLENERK